MLLFFSCDTALLWTYINCKALDCRGLRVYPTVPDRTFSVSKSSFSSSLLESPVHSLKD